MRCKQTKGIYYLSVLIVAGNAPWRVVFGPKLRRNLVLKDYLIHIP